MAAEHREMQRLGIANGDIRSFRKGKNAGKALSELCYPRHDSKWIQGLIRNAGYEAPFNQLQAKLTNATTAEDAAFSQIKRIKIPDLRLGS